MTTNVCITDDEVSRLFEGRLSAEEQVRIDGHVDDCPRCFDLVAELAQALASGPDHAHSRVTPSASTESTPGPEQGQAASGVLPRGAVVERRYQIREIVGVGGMGVVYAAYDRSLERRVALKVLRRDSGRGEFAEQAESKLVREARALARLSHPNVVVVYDVGLAEGRVFIAMELVAGRTLRAWLEDQPRRSRDEILEVFIAAGRGLAAAHAAGVIHRDFKPDNVLVGDDGRVRVTDFGLARSLQTATLLESGRPPAAAPTSARETASAIAGTPRYMAPEQMWGRRSDAQSDQFAFCVALFEALCNRPPFPLDNLAVRLAAIEAGRQPNVTADMPHWLRDVLHRGLQAEPARRFPTMNALCEALERGRGRRGWLLAWGAAGLAAMGALLAANLPAQSDGGEPRCEPAVARLAGVWDDAVRGALGAKVLQVNDPATLTAWSRLERQLDTIAADWTGQYEAACSTGPAAATTLACLHQVLDQIGGVTDMAARADARTLTFLAGSHLQERLTANCSGPEAARYFDPLPTDRIERARVAELRMRLDEALTFENRGRLADARVIAAAAVEQAESIGFQPVIAEALLRRGTVEHKQGELGRAQQTLERALAMAEVARHDRRIPEIWMALVVVDTSLGRLAEASRGLDRATAFLSRSPLSPLSRARLDSTRAHVLRALGRHREAIAADVAARSQYELVPDSDLYVAGALVAEATSHIALGEWTQVLELNRRAHELRERHLGPEHTRVAGALNNMGSAMLALGDFDGARAELEQARGIRERLGSSGELELTTVLLNLGYLERELGALPTAREHFERAVRIRERILGPGHALVAEALQGLGSLRVVEGEVAEGKALLARASAILDRALGVSHTTTLLTQVELAKAELAGGEVATARTRLEQAVEGLRAVEVAPEDRACAEFTLARALVASGGDVAQARRLAERARDVYGGLGPGRARRLAEVEVWLAREVL